MAYSYDQYLEMFNTLIKTNYLNMYFPWKEDPKASIPDELYNIIFSWDSLSPEKKKDNIKSMLRDSEIFSCFRLSSCVSFGEEVFDPTQENYENCTYDGYEECYNQSKYLIKLINFINGSVNSSILSRISLSYYYENKNLKSLKKPRNLKNK